MSITFEETVKRVAAINDKLRDKNFNLEEIDEFWNKLFQLIPIIKKTPLQEIKICIGCGHLNIEPIKAPAMACCPDSNYMPIVINNRIGIKWTESNRGISLAKKIELNTGVKLSPKIGRRYFDNDLVKFEMLDIHGFAYHFEGKVIDFLKDGVKIILVDRTFKLENNW